MRTGQEKLCNSMIGGLHSLPWTRWRARAAARAGTLGSSKIRSVPQRHEIVYHRIRMYILLGQTDKQQTRHSLMGERGGTNWKRGRCLVSILNLHRAVRASARQIEIENRCAHTCSLRAFLLPPDGQGASPMQHQVTLITSTKALA